MDLEEFTIRLKPLPWKAAAWVAAFSFLAASVVSVAVGWFVMSNMESASKTAGQMPNQLASAPVSAVRPVFTDSEVDLILKRNLFNSDGSLGEDDGRSDNQEEIPKSDLALKLLGVITAGNPLNGMATIENNSTNPPGVGSFAVGEYVMKETRLAEVYRRRVIIERNGQKSYIELQDLPIRRSSRLAGKAAETAPTSSGGIAPVVTRPPPPSYKEPGLERDGGKIKMSTDFKDRLLSKEGLPQVLQDAKAEPYMTDGALKGFRLTKIRENSIYDKAGLQNDDIVEEINGVPMTSASGAIGTLQKLRNEKEIEIRIKRGESSLTINLNVM